MTQPERRPAQIRAKTDAELKLAVVEELRWTPSVDSTHVGVSVDHGAVTLSGEVASYPEKRDAERAVQRVHGVRAIAEELSVRESVLAVSDSHIAREAGEAVDKAVDVPKDCVQVTVRGHVVSLTGTVPWHFQREAAARAVHHLRGVWDVRNLVQLKPAVSTRNIKDEIAAAMLRSATLQAEKCVVTADAAGAVTLTGAVESWAELRQAEHVAWSAPGVTAVHNNLHLR